MNFLALLKQTKTLGVSIYVWKKPDANLPENTLFVGVGWINYTSCEELLIELRLVPSVMWVAMLMR